MLSPLNQILLGFFLLIGGWLVLLFTVAELLPASMPLSIGAYMANTAGLFVGVLGAAAYVRERRGDD